MDYDEVRKPLEKFVYGLDGTCSAVASVSCSPCLKHKKRHQKNPINKVNEGAKLCHPLAARCLR